MIAASFGKMPTTSVRRLISPLRRSSVSMRRSFQLPTSWIGPDGDANGNVVEAGEAAPHDHVAGRRIAVAGEIAAEHGDLQQVVGKRPALQSWSSACRIDAVERAD